MLPFVAIALTGVPATATFALGVPGADLTVGDALEAVDVVEGVALAATRGVSGVRVLRFDASVGLNGLAALRSVDIGATERSLQAQLSLFAQNHGVTEVQLPSREYPMASECHPSPPAIEHFFPCAACCCDPNSRPNPASNNPTVAQLPIIQRV